MLLKNLPVKMLPRGEIQMVWKSKFALPLRDHHSDVLLTSFSAKGVPDFWLTALKTNDVLTEEAIHSVLYF